MGLRALLGVALLGASAGLAVGQAGQTTLVVPPAPLLPVQLGDWVKGDAPPADSVAQADDPVLAESGLKRQERAVYHSGANPQQTIAVTAYQFVDATGAHSAYSYYQRPGGYKGPKIGDETANGFLFRSGTTLVSVDSKLPVDQTAMVLRDLETHLPKVGGPKGLPPLLPTYLPAKGLQTDSVKYALGPLSYKAMGGMLPGEIIGFDKAAEVVTAKYAGQGTLTLLLYPTPQIAGEHGRAIVEEVNRIGPPAGTVLLRREGPLVLMTTGAWDAAEAKRMVEGIHLRNELTWNKPVPLEFHAEVLKTYSLLTSIAIFCGVGALAAVILGLFLGGGRAAIRVLQGKPAASEPEFLRIDLSGRVAAIHPEGIEGEAQR
ncbi:hypothetical protein EDE15_3209 [Edaphobacter aggregans]|uniref:Uncharacterized protein n=2 Tax=Edaphobacter aggregans TaxID=570835 RepID=A0A428MLR1_9BACT|nr:hypothetical protein EDE15_3209 [Edaphobacter aggregans]